MKKYQLKKGETILVDSDDIYDIFWEIRYLNSVEYQLKDLSIWMDGKELK